LTLQLLRPLRVKNTNLENDVIRGVTAHFTSLPDPDEAGIEKCEGMAMNSVPEPYLDAWARLQCQKPVPVPEIQWRQAIDDAGRFLDQWGGHAVEFCWTPADLFEAPAYGKSGLVWFLRGETVESLGPGHAGLGPGKRVFDRINHTDWINPYLQNQADEPHIKYELAPRRLRRWSPGGAVLLGACNDPQAE
jgi:hypothetical protein